MAHSRGASHQTVRLKPESPFVEANVTMSHRPASLHLSLSGWYPAVPFSCNSFSVCLHLFLLLFPSLSISTPCLALKPPHHVHVSVFQKSLLTTEAFSFSTLYLPRLPFQMLPSQLSLCCVYLFPFLFWHCLSLASHHSASAEL